jgi:hypothetical protein
MMESLRTKYGVTHVISVAAELDDNTLNVPTGELEFLHIKWLDDGTPKPIEDFLQAIRWIVSESERKSAQGPNLPVLYVHCLAGVNRGPMLATAISSILTGIDPAVAWSYIHARRPQAQAWNVPAYQQSIIAAWEAYHGPRLAGAPSSDVWQAVAADYDGDGEIDFAEWRPSDGAWHIVFSSDGSIHTEQWGQPGDAPVPGDYDGDGKADIAVWRPSEGKWHVLSSSTRSEQVRMWGLPTDVPAPADYDHDGRCDYAVWRPSEDRWYIVQSSDGRQIYRQQDGQVGEVGPG